MIRNEFNVYDGLNQVIISVAIAPVKPNVFLPEIRYVLVVCTPVEVVLLALTLSPTSELNIHPSFTN